MSSALKRKAFPANAVTWAEAAVRRRGGGQAGCLGGGRRPAPLQVHAPLGCLDSRPKKTRQARPAAPTQKIAEPTLAQTAFDKHSLKDFREGFMAQPGMEVWIYSHQFCIHFACAANRLGGGSCPYDLPRLWE